jgi:hypothetical protein
MAKTGFVRPAILWALAAVHRYCLKREAIRRINSELVDFV